MASEKESTEGRPATRGAKRGDRRSFLLLIPALVFASAAGTVVAAALRFLRPLASSGAGESWTTLAPVAELAGAQPAARKVAFERAAGWTSAREERLVYVLGRGEARRVLSAVCPHEGCEVLWRAEERDFFCPCHDSRFSPEGDPMSGPARAPLAELPARVENGLLQVQFPAEEFGGRQAT